VGGVLKVKEPKYEKPINLRASGSIRRKEAKHYGNGALRAFRVERSRFDLAICSATELAAPGASWDGERAADCVVKTGLFDNE
jgi:hypothetical protein